MFQLIKIEHVPKTPTIDLTKTEHLQDVWYMGLKQVNVMFVFTCSRCVKLNITCVFITSCDILFTAILFTSAPVDCLLSTTVASYTCLRVCRRFR